jgi:hypothetical protein
MEESQNALRDDFKRAVKTIVKLKSMVISLDGNLKALESNDNNTFCHDSDTIDKPETQTEITSYPLSVTPTTPKYHTRQPFYSLQV